MSNEITDAQKLEELKQYADDLGLTYRENIGLPKLEEKIAEKEAAIAEKRKREKAEQAKLKNQKVKVVIEPRDRDAGINEQFFGYTSMATGMSENVLIKFGEECEITEGLYHHIKNITYTDKVYKSEVGEDGIRRPVLKDKQKTRFIISKV